MAKSVQIEEVTFVVVDLETTGSIPGRDAITEIGAVKVRNGEIIDRFQTLVNPEQEIPPFIQNLTGITPEMVQDAPAIQTVMPEFWEFLGESVFVAHHVPFDFRFLNAITKSMLGSGLDNEQLCTCRLAKKLLPQLRRRNLGAVCEHFQIQIAQRHRAMGDAEATALVLIEYLNMLREMGINTLSRLLDYQKKGGKRYGALNVPFPEDRVSEFSQQPGVYLMRDEKGEILYIGKAKNLRRRLKSYFTNLYRQPTKVQELMQQVFDIETRVLGSELEALLEESYLIKQHQPYYNRQIKNFRTFPFLKISMQQQYPRISITTEIEQDDALYFGPYQRKRHLSGLIESLSKVFQLRDCSDSMFKKHQRRGVPCLAYEVGRCSGPCVRQISTEAYRMQTEEIIQFLEGQGSGLTQRMIQQRDKYSEQMAFEKAKQTQDRLIELLKLQTNTHFLTMAVHQNHLVIALPDREFPRQLVLYVYKGRPILKQVFDPRDDRVESVLERVRMLQHMIQANLEDKRDVIQQRELEEIRIIAHWLRYHQPDPQIQIWRLSETEFNVFESIEQYFGQRPIDWTQDSPLLQQA